MQTRIGLLVSMVVSVGLLAACQTPAREVPGLHRYSFRSDHMGTLFEITLYTTNQSTAEQAADAAFRRIVGLENTMSDYQADSELNELCRKPYGRLVRVSTDLFNMLTRAQRFARASDGAFDPTVGPYVRLWRFARKRKVLPSEAEMAAAHRAVGYQNVKLDARNETVMLLAEGMRLDLGGIAKGYAADEALRALRSYGITRALVAASGDIAVGDPPQGERAWRVTITGLNSRSTNSQPVLYLRNAAVSTSGDTEQFIEIQGTRYSHILNPATGLGLTNRIQATVVTPDATTTDALATTVCVLGRTRGEKLLQKFPGTGAWIITASESGQFTATQTKAFKKLLSPPQ